MSMQDRELGWDDIIEREGQEMPPAGDYDFEVESVERGRHPGSDKLPACNKAVVTLRLIVPGGDEFSMKHQLFLHTSTEGLLCAFFASIGLKKKGEPLKMNWQAVPGSRGRCKLGTRKYTNDDGEERTYPDIKKFYPAAAQAAPATGYQKGRF